MSTSRRSRRGNVALIMAVVSVVAVGIGALVFDIGNSRMVQVQLQNGVDAAAHGAVTRIVELGRDSDGRTDADLVTGRTMGKSVAAANTVNGHALNIPLTDIQTGVWDDGTFTASTDATVVNSVRVTASEPGIFAPLYSIFSQVSGRKNSSSTITESAASVAIIPDPQVPSTVECYLPIAIPSCAITKYGEDVLSSYNFYPSPDKADTGGWGMLFSVASANNVKTQISSCTQAGEISVGDDVKLNNGSMTSAFQEMDAQIEASSTSWNSSQLGTIPTQQTKSSILKSKYGKTLEGPILVFTASNCTNIKYNQAYPLAGFAWGVVFDVVSSGSPKFISMRINNKVSMDFGTAGGGSGSDYGVIYSPPPMLVY